MVGKLNEQAQQLFDALMTIPPDFEHAEQMLQHGGYSSDEVSRVALEYAEECFCDANQDEEYPVDLFKDGILLERHSSYLYQVTELLLRFGLNPNYIHEDNSILLSLRFVDNEYVAADTMVLLLEHGADLNLFVPPETVFEAIDFDVFYDTAGQRIRHRFDSLVHCWLVLLGYGGRYKYPNAHVTLFREFDSAETFDLKKLRDHRNYYVGISRENSKEVIHIYDRRTFWEVARII